MIAIYIRFKKAGRHSFTIPKSNVAYHSINSYPRIAKNFDPQWIVCVNADPNAPPIFYFRPNLNPESIRVSEYLAIEELT